MNIINKGVKYPSFAAQYIAAVRAKCTTSIQAINYMMETFDMPEQVAEHIINSHTQGE